MNNGDEFIDCDGRGAFEISKYQRYRRYDGKVVLAEIGWRNGKKVFMVRPTDVDAFDSESSLSRAEYLGILRALYANLTKIQRRTWHKLLNQQPILEIAKEERVKPAAIYSRIHSMINRNGFCKRWWRRRDRRNQYR